MEDLLAAGAAAYGSGDVAGALRTFEQAAQTLTGDKRIAAMINMASMSDELGDHASAADAFRAALAEMPAEAGRMRPGALINLSQALQHVGDLDGAQDALEQARAVLLDKPDLADLLVPCLLSLTAVAIHRQQWARATELATESLDAAVQYAPHLAGHPLMNLAATNFETGRWDLAEDFATQAMAAFDAAGDVNAVAETQQNLALMRLRSDRIDEAEPLLQSSQAYFQQAGLGYRFGIGLKAMALLAENRGQLDMATDLYGQSAQYFRDSGAVIDVADVNTRLATLSFATERIEDGERFLAEAFATYAACGLGLHCAQLDFWHASLLESTAAAPEDSLLRLAIPAALAIDAVRCTFANGHQRAQWNRQIADPAMRLAFRLAYAGGHTELVADLIESQCAGTALDADNSGDASPTTTVQTLLEPPTDERVDAGALALGTALADVAASAGLPVSPPARVAVSPDGRIALARFIDIAEERYGREIRDSRVLPAW